MFDWLKRVFGKEDSKRKRYHVDKERYRTGKIRSPGQKVDYLNTRYYDDVMDELDSSPYPSKTRAEALGLARNLLVYADKTGDLDAGYKAANLYEKLGQLESISVERRLVHVGSIARKKAEEIRKEGGLKDSREFFEARDKAYKYLDYIDDLLYHTPKDRIKAARRYKYHSNIEHLTEATTAIIGLIIGLYLLSPGISGSVIGSFNSASSILGLLFFLVGIIGIYFWVKKNY